MRNYFTFNSNDSRNYGVYISGSGVYNAPEHVYDAIKIPGRNGDLLIDRHKFENIKVTYPAFICDDFKNKLASLRSMLLSQNGYQKLVDSYHTDEYRMAYFAGGINVKPREQNDAGEFDLTFICKPQRFLNSGDTATTITSSTGTISNPTLFDSKPLIRVTGYGTLTIGSDVITIANTYAYVDIDSELQDCYHGSDNANAQVTFQSNNFPVLKPGTNNIAISGNITSVKITPRWFIV